MAKADLTAQRVRELFAYDLATGHLIRIKSRSGAGKVGEPAGGIGGAGYRRIEIDGKSYQAHVLVWLYHHGDFPSGPLDHINRVRDDNRIENLRLVTAAQNSQNRAKDVATSSGRLGGSYIARLRSWKAQITVEGNTYYLGCFKALADAIAVREQAERDFGFL